MGFFKDLKKQFKDVKDEFIPPSSAPSTGPSWQSIPPAHPGQSIQRPTAQDLFQYRSHNGTNLGSIFVLERWLSGSVFESVNATGESELAAVSASVSAVGLDETRRKWEDRWRHALSDDDLRWLVEQAKCTSIRLPIGYFTLGARFCAGTPFEPFGVVYENAWAAAKHVIQRCAEYGISVLIDLHALPGGANGDMHSGTDSGSTVLWSSNANRQLAQQCAVFVAAEAKGMLNLCGVQIVNESDRVAPGKGMFEWYEAVLSGITSVNPSIPVYVSDAWDLPNAMNWLGGRKRDNWTGNPIVVDTHKYFTFSDFDRSQAPQEIIARVPGELGELNGRSGSVVDKGAVQVVVGEWSCVMDGKTWGRSDPAQKDELVKQFGHVQADRWRSALGSGGSFFWTLKMDWMDGGEWGFVEMNKKVALSLPPWLMLSPQEVQQRLAIANGQRQQRSQTSINNHIGYWNSTSPGEAFEHGWYAEAWNIGWEDAKFFFSARLDSGLLGHVTQQAGGGEKIGCLEIWVRKRLIESGRRGKYIWEWEQGFRQGVKDFETAVGI